MITPTFLHLNLTNQTSEVKSYEEFVPKIGGLGWALSIFEKFIEEEPIVFASGPLNGIFPGASKTIAVFRSPQTNGLATSLGGGHLSRLMRFAGYQGIIITGKANTPTFISIEEGNVSFKEATPLLGLEVPKLFERTFSAEGAPGRRTVVASGPAAEQGFTFAPLYLDEFFSFPRGGLGRAFAQRNLKGFSIVGGKSEPISQPRRYQEVFNSLIKKLKGYEELSSLGTLRNLAVEKKISGVPFENLRESNFEGDELLAHQFLRKSARVSCGGCPVGCIHLLRRGEKFTFYDYESVVALGLLLGITNQEEVGQLLEKAWGLGLDPTSLGVILAAVTEQGGLSFGSLETYLTLIDALAAGKEDWALRLRSGLLPGPHALTIGGSEFLPYFNGYASILSQALRLGETTEENRGFLLDLDLIHKDLEPKAVVGQLVALEEKKTLAQLLVGCGYLASVYEDPAVAFSAMEALGSPVSHEQLEEVKKEVFRQKLALQKRLGFVPSDVKISEKFFRLPSPHGFLKEESLREMVKIYEKDVYATAT